MSYNIISNISLEKLYYMYYEEHKILSDFIIYA